MKFNYFNLIVYYHFMQKLFQTIPIYLYVIETCKILFILIFIHANRNNNL